MKLPQKEPEKRRSRVLIVDDHPIVRDGLRTLLERQPGLEVCGEAGNPLEAISAVKKLKPDIVLVDLSLEKSSGIELMQQLRTINPKLRMLALSMHDESLYADQALRAGAQGYLMKHSPPDQLIQAIRDVLEGRISVSASVAHRLLQQAAAGRAPTRSPVDSLSKRELEVFELVGQGVGPNQIAQKLNLSVKTVEVHRANIKRKLNARGVTEVLHRAIMWVREKK